MSGRAAKTSREGETTDGIRISLRHTKVVLRSTYQGVTTDLIFVAPRFDSSQALAMSLSGLDVRQSEPECVICMEGFTDSDPKMLTLCECGVNKTCFHYSCLLQWVSRDPSCPACRKELMWEEQGAAQMDWSKLEGGEEGEGGGGGEDEYDDDTYDYDDEKEEGKVYSDFDDEA